MTGTLCLPRKHSRLSLALAALLTLGLFFGVRAAFVGAVYFDNAATDADFAADVLDPASGLSAAPLNVNTVSMTWTATPDTYATGYRVMRSDGGAFVEIATVTPRTSTAYDDGDIGLLGLGTYSYYVVAYYEGWNSVASNTVTCLRILLVLTC
jgi:hypothetical protein